jgi:alpha-galactosidase
MKGGENEMQNDGRDRLWLVNALIAEEVRRAEANRLVARPATSIRRAIGTSIVRLGTRLAGEPTYELARSR